MKFGTVDKALLSGLNLSLPPDPAFNSKVLKGSAVTEPRVYVGCGNWGHPSWSGLVYPPRTPATRYRELYPKYFHTMELNATHYQVYGAEVIRQWAASAAGRDFRYCPKFPQQISHYSSFAGVEGMTDAFLDGVRAFGEHLGPLFLQVSDGFAPSKKGPLLEYVRSLPRDVDVFLEFRHPEWFEEPEVHFAFLRDMGRGLVITDTPGRRDAVHMHLTVPRLMLRFVCNGDHPTSFSRIDAWTERISQWLGSGLEEAYIFLHPGDEVHVPALAHYWTDRLNKVCGLRLPLPYVKQETLF